MKAMPLSPGSVSLEYELYQNKHSQDRSAFEPFDAFIKRIENEDIGLCTQVQPNLDSVCLSPVCSTNVDGLLISQGGYVFGPLHPRNEQGVLYFQQLVRDALKKHKDEESKLGREIWSAQRERQNMGNIDEDEKFCASLCGIKEQLEEVA